MYMLTCVICSNSNSNHTGVSLSLLEQNRYLDLFSHKLCCFTDLESYLSAIMEEGIVSNRVIGEMSQMMESQYPADTLEVAHFFEHVLF